MTRSWKILFAAGSVVAALCSSQAMAQQANPASDSASPTVSSAPPLGRHHGLLFGSQYRRPGLAVALSLTPLPVDFGNLYAENVGWGVAYTAVEVSLMAPMMWFVGGHMDHGRDDTRSWTDGERNVMVGLLSGYVAVKLVAGLHAGYAARDFNQRLAIAPSVAVVPIPGGAAGFAGLSF